MERSLELSRRPAGPWRGRFVLFLALVVGALLAGAAGFGVVGAQAAPADGAGYRDFSYGNAVTSPTAEKPQSKLWFNDGIWWGDLFDTATNDYHIFRFDRAGHAWTDTGTPLDPRPNTKADTLWDGEHLYVASASSSETASDKRALLMRYSYDAAAKKYTADPEFRPTFPLDPTTAKGVKVAEGPIEALVLDKDTSGQLWVTYTQGGKVWVNRSLDNEATWGTPFVLPAEGTTVTTDDISAIVAFDSKVGVMWSNQIDDALYFSVHNNDDPDEVWQPSEKALQGRKSADDHINLKFNVQSDGGKVYAAVKTSADELSPQDPNAPLIELLVTDQGGTFTKHVVGRVSERYTRPIVMLDRENRGVYVFSTVNAPGSASGGTIYYKKASMDNPTFPEGTGTPFIQSSTDTLVNNATSTKQNMNGDSGILISASDNSSRFYLHNTIDLPTRDTTAPTVDAVTPQPEATNVNVATDVEARFSEAMDETTLNDTTFALVKQGATTSVPAVYTYDGASRKLVLNPETNLDPSSTYTATIEGGDAGAKDAAGNPLAEDKVWTFTTGEPPDTAAPDTQITSGPAGTTAGRSASFSFSATEAGSRFECSLDGAAYAACASPKDYANLPDGAHTFAVRAIDAAGNADASPATRTFTVDLTAPRGTIRINGTAARTTSPKVRLTLRASDAGSGVAYMRLKNAGKAWTGWIPYAPSKTWRLTGGAGVKYVYVQYRDGVGNISPAARDGIRYAPRR